MFHRKLIVVEDVDFGGLGLKFEEKYKFCNGRFSAQDGIILAHDIVEHQQGPAKIGTIGDEMIALGGVCLARGMWGDLRRDIKNTVFTPAQNIAGDIINMSELYFLQNIPFRQKLVKSRCEDQSDLVDDVIEEAREALKLEDYWEYEDHIPTQDKLDSYLEDCRTYMLHGVKLAIRRFGSGHLAYDVFWDIEQATSECLSYIELAGQKFTLSYDFNGNAKIE